MRIVNTCFIFNNLKTFYGRLHFKGRYLIRSRTSTVAVAAAAATAVGVAILSQFIMTGSNCMIKKVLGPRR